MKELLTFLRCRLDCDYVIVQAHPYNSELPHVEDNSKHIIKTSALLQ